MKKDVLVIIFIIINTIFILAAVLNDGWTGRAIGWPSFVFLIFILYFLFKQKKYLFSFWALFLILIFYFNGEINKLNFVQKIKYPEFRAVVEVQKDRYVSNSIFIPNNIDLYIENNPRAKIIKDEYSVNDGLKQEKIF